MTKREQTVDQTFGSRVLAPGRRPEAKLSHSLQDDQRPGFLNYPLMLCALSFELNLLFGGVSACMGGICWGTGRGDALPSAGPLNIMPQTYATGSQLDIHLAGCPTCGKCEAPVSDVRHVPPWFSQPVAWGAFPLRLLGGCRIVPMLFFFPRWVKVQTAEHKG